MFSGRLLPVLRRGCLTASASHSCAARVSVCGVNQRRSYATGISKQSAKKTVSRKAADQVSETVEPKEPTRNEPFAKNLFLGKYNVVSNRFGVLFHMANC